MSIRYIEVERKIKKKQDASFNEIYITLNKRFGKYGNILLTGDLNIDEIHQSLLEIRQITSLMLRMSLTLPSMLRNLLALNRNMVLLLT